MGESGDDRLLSEKLLGFICEGVGCVHSRPQDDTELFQVELAGERPIRNPCLLANGRPWRPVHTEANGDTMGGPQSSFISSKSPTT